MAPRITLTPIDAETELQHGMPFVVKWRNPATNKLDLWIGIHVPADLAVGISKLKGTAAVASEEALKYVIYLPGRNTFRWIDIKSLYPLSEYSPEEYEQAGREYAGVYKRLHLTAQQTDDIRFWSRIAKKERNHKDRNDRVPSIDFAPAEASAQESEAGIELEDDGEDMSEAEGDLEGVASVYSGQVDSIKRPHREGSVSTPHKKAKTGASVGQHRHQQQPDSEEVVDIYIGNGTNQKVFHLTRNKIMKSTFLNDCVQGKPPYIMHPYLQQMTPAEFKPVHALLSGDAGLDSDLVSVCGDGGDNDERKEIIGDVNKVGKNWMLKDIHSIEDLKALILGLESTYAQAFLFGLAEMADNVLTKVQVAWNLYGRVEHLSLFLNFIENVMPNIIPQVSARGGAPDAYHGGQSSYGLGTKHSWIIKYLAETFVLYTTEDPQRFWCLVDKYPSLRAAIFKHRAALDDAKLLVLENEFRQREPLAEASFATPVTMEGSVEQEATTKEEGAEQMADAGTE